MTSDRARNRLDRLEKRGASNEDPDAPRRRMGMFLLHKLIGNHRREVRGEEPISLTPEEEEFQREEDRRFIREGGLRRFREDPGWQDEKSQAFLDELEERRSRTERPTGGIEP